MNDIYIGDQVLKFDQPETKTAAKEFDRLPDEGGGRAGTRRESVRDQPIGKERKITCE